MAGFEIGKVVSFNGSYGKIVAKTGEYLFLREDIDDKMLISVGRVVIFRGEKVQDTNRAFFVKGAETILPKKVKKKI